MQVENNFTELFAEFNLYFTERFKIRETVVTVSKSETLNLKIEDHRSLRRFSLAPILTLPSILVHDAGQSARSILTVNQPAVFGFVFSFSV